MALTSPCGQRDQNVPCFAAFMRWIVDAFPCSATGSNTAPSRSKARAHPITSSIPDHTQSLPSIPDVPRISRPAISKRYLVRDHDVPFQLQILAFLLLLLQLRA